MGLSVRWAEVLLWSVSCLCCTPLQMEVIPWGRQCHPVLPHSHASPPATREAPAAFLTPHSPPWLPDLPHLCL